MCVSKIRILNKGYNPLDFLSTKYIEVPCGKCWQCRMQRSNDYSFRLLYEIKSNNLIPFFVTLTYSPEYLPILKYRDKTGCVHDISVWNRQHLQNFHKTLRRQLHYYYGIPKSAFKYLCVCERGSNHTYVDSHGVSRVARSLPHYHGLYALSDYSDCEPIRDLPDNFYTYCSDHACKPDFVNFFRYLLHSKWFFGIVDDVAFCRDIVASVRYVCKYIMKDYGECIFGINPEDCISLHDKRFSDLQHKCIESNDFKKAPKPVSLSDLLPRCISSINLGLGFIQDKSISELSSLCSGKTSVPLPSVRSCSMIQLPSYYFKKLCYDRVKLHLDRWYTRVVNTDSFYGVKGFLTSPRYHVQSVWNNVFGFEKVCNKSPYFVSVVSDFGRFIKRLRFIRLYKKLKLYAKVFIRDRSYLRFLVSSFNGFADHIKSSLVTPSVDFLSSLEKVSLSFGLADFLCYRRCVCDPYLSNLFNLLTLCNFTQSHLRHLAYEKNYSKKLCSTASDNPDLFLFHII